MFRIKQKILSFSKPKFQGTVDWDDGSRIPAVWIHPNLPYIEIQVATMLGDDWNYYFSVVSDTVNKGDWFTLKMSQRDGLYKVKIDNELVHSVVNPTPQTWKNVKIVTGNTYGNSIFIPAVGEYRNLEVYSFPEERKSFFQPFAPSYKFNSFSKTYRTRFYFSTNKHKL